MDDVLRGADHLECTGCEASVPSEQLLRLSACCQKPLYARYDLEHLAADFTPDALKARRPDLYSPLTVPTGQEVDMRTARVAGKGG